MPNFSKQLIGWYKKNKRDLPWRNTKNPYEIWLSEVILQQTRVAQGMDYYLKFVEKFPKVEFLAAASEQEVLNLWQGLGYYSRARNLHAAAKQISTALNGNFPNNFNELKKLKGVGDYTASAIASFAFDEAVAVVDGNVFRVLARIYGIETPINSGEGFHSFKNLAQELLDSKNVALHNQAIMEFGALQCTPKNPNCNDCPFSNSCFAKNNNKIDALPVKIKSKASSNRYFNYVFIQIQDSILMQKRVANDIWKGLWQPVLIESHSLLNEEELLFELEKLQLVRDFRICNILNETVHKLSHRNIFSQALHIKSDSATIDKTDFQLISKCDFEKIPLSRLVEKYFVKL